MQILFWVQRASQNFSSCIFKIWQVIALQNRQTSPTDQLFTSNEFYFLSDALHLLSDVAGYLVSIAAIVTHVQDSFSMHSFCFNEYMANWMANEKMTWGYKRCEILGAVVSVLMIWIITLYLVYEAVTPLKNALTKVSVLLRLCGHILLQSQHFCFIFTKCAHTLSDVSYCGSSNCTGSPDPGAFNDGSNVQIWPLGTELVTFEVARALNNSEFSGGDFCQFIFNLVAVSPLQNSLDRPQVVDFEVWPTIGCASVSTFQRALIWRRAAQMRVCETLFLKLGAKCGSTDCTAKSPKTETLAFTKSSVILVFA